MKRILLAVLLAAGLASSLQAAETCSQTDAADRKNGQLPSCLAFDAATSDGDSAVINTFGYRNLSLEAWSATTSVVTVNILCRGNTAAPWKVCATAMTNPTSDSTSTFYVSLARAYQYKINLSGYASGAVSVSFERYND